MSIFALIMAVIVAVEHLFILWLEMFNSNSEMASRAFAVPRKLLQVTEVQTLFKNQGLYNGFLAVGIIFACFLSDPIRNVMVLYLVGCVVIAAIYGAMTASKRIILIQGLPAVIAFCLVAVAW